MYQEGFQISREEAKTALLKDFKNETANFQRTKRVSVISTLLLLAIVTVVLVMPVNIVFGDGFLISVILIGVVSMWIITGISKYTVRKKRENLQNAGIEV